MLVLVIPCTYTNSTVVLWKVFFVCHTTNFFTLKITMKKKITDVFAISYTYQYFNIEYYKYWKTSKQTLVIQLQYLYMLDAGVQYCTVHYYISMASYSLVSVAVVTPTYYSTL